MKNITFCILLCLIAIGSHATHLVTGDITYKRLQTFADKSVEYEIELTLIRDNDSSTVFFDDSAYVGVYDKKSLKLVKSFTMINPKSSSFSDLLCINKGNNDSYVKGIYTSTITLPENKEGYWVTWERCCKSKFLNISYPRSRVEQPFYLIADIPNTDIVNSSPDIPYLIQGFCLNQKGQWSLSLFDRDGDSLSIALSPIYQGRAEPTQNLAAPKPGEDFTPKKEVTFENGYVYSYPFGFSYPVVIKNNQLEFTPTKEGMYTVGLEVKEFRDGVLISSHTVDIGARIFACSGQEKSAPKAFYIEEYDVMRPLLTWNTCGSAVEYFEIRRRNSSTQNFTKIDTVSEEINRYIDLSLTKSDEYFYKVIGVPKSGQESGETEVRSIQMFNLGAENYLAQPLLNIYPNPILNEFQIECSADIEEIIITNNFGQVVSHQNPSGSICTIKLEDKPGIYFITIRTNQGVVTKKLVKQDE